MKFDKILDKKVNEIARRTTKSVWEGKLWDLELLKVAEIDGGFIPATESDKSALWRVYKRPSARNPNYYDKDRLPVWLHDFPDHSSAVEFIVYLRKLLNPKKVRKPRKMQVLLDLVIDGGTYAPIDKPYKDSSHFMCRAVTLSDKLTEKEKDKVIRKIDKYIKNEFSLEHILHNNGLPSDFEARLFLYRNWKKRPVLSIK